jgi:hypothetical protein
VEGAVVLRENWEVRSASWDLRRGSWEVIDLGGVRSGRGLFEEF